MQKLTQGEFYGTHYEKLVLDNCIITDTEYTHERVDWHYHENPYFTYLLEGKLFESNKKESYYLDAGSLLFHNWQDAHYNIKPPQYTRGFHIELNANWFDNYGVDTTNFEGSFAVQNPVVKSLMNNVFVESKTNDIYAKLSIETLVLDIFDSMKKTSSYKVNRPSWVSNLREFIHEENCDFSLRSLSDVLQIHPTHLSRDFSRYFGTTLGNYVRLIKLNKAFSLLLTSKLSVTEVGYQCGFYDQSHFTKHFKQVYGFPPKQLQRQISRR
jgi:AraC-like DNA-binding protein